MLNSFVNPKAIHKATQATVDPYEVALDSGMDFVEPETPEPAAYYGSNRGCFEESAVTKKSGLARTEKKFGVQVVGVLDKRRVNGYYRCKLLCLDGSVLDDDVSPEELEALPEVRKTSAFEEWETGGYPTDPIMDLAFHKEENKDKLSSCILCGRTLTHPKSVKRHIGPECIKTITPSGSTFIEGEEVAQGLIRASEAYSEEPFQKWIIKAVLILDAPIPDTVLFWQGEEYFGYKNKPSLYYLDILGKLHCVEVKKRKLVYREVKKAASDSYILDCHAIKMAPPRKTDLFYGTPLPRYRGVDFEIEEVINHSPYLKKQWFIKEGQRRISVYQEINGHLWCNCRKKNCRHIQVLKDGGWIK